MNCANKYDLELSMIPLKQRGDLTKSSSFSSRLRILWDWRKTWLFIVAAEKWEIHACAEIINLQTKQMYKDIADICHRYTNYIEKFIGWKSTVDSIVCIFQMKKIFFLSYTNYSFNSSWSFLWKMFMCVHKQISSAFQKEILFRSKF